MADIMGSMKEGKSSYSYVIAGACFCIQAIGIGTHISFGVFFNPLMSEFGWSRALISGTSSVAFLFMGLLGIYVGRLNDRIGPRKMMTITGLFFGFGLLLMSRLDSIWQLYLFYGVIVGTGMSGSFVPLMSTVARWFLERRSIMTGIVLAGIGVGALLAPPVANQLISIYDWRVSYIILGSIVLLVVVLAAQLIKRDPAQMGQVPYGENEGGEQGSKSLTEGFSLREAALTKQFWLVLGMFLSQVNLRLIRSSSPMVLLITTSISV